MVTIEYKEYLDTTSDTMRVETTESFVELMIDHSSSCWPCDNPDTIREVAAQLLRAADILEKGTNS